MEPILLMWWCSLVKDGTNDVLFPVQKLDLIEKKNFFQWSLKVIKIRKSNQDQHAVDHVVIRK